MNMNDKDILIEFAEKIGKLSQAVSNIKSNFKTHIEQHKVDRIMQWVIIGLQTLVIMFLGWMKLSGKM
jgi:hypothetical protein